MDDQLDPKLLDNIDEGRRASLKKILLGSAFAIPVIASFTMSGLGTAEALPVGKKNTTQGNHHHHHDHHDHHHQHHDHHQHHHDHHDHHHDHHHK